MHRRGGAQPENSDDTQPLTSTNTQTTVVDPAMMTVTARYAEPGITSSQGYMNTVTGFANQAIQSAGSVFSGFKGAMKDILPQLDKEEQTECFGTFNEYHELLMTTQRFVTRTLLRVRRAHRTNELLQSIDLPTIRALCVQIRGLLNRFRRIEVIIEEKVKEERTIKNWRNICLGVFALAGAICLITTGVGVGIGFAVGVKATIAISGAAAAVAATGALTTHIAQKLTTFEAVMTNLRDIEALLGEISQNYAKVEAMGDLLLEDDNSKQEFIKLLDDIQKEIDKGFALLTKM